jgi:LysM repeat protein
VGDTLSQIALRFGVSLEALKAANNLQGDLVYAGRELVIPSGGMPVVPLLPTAHPTLAGYHIVAAGETLADIADEYQTTIPALRAVNAMYGDALLPGQQLAIPTTTTVTTPTWQYSIAEGNLLLAYPSSLETDRFTLHYTPGTFPAIDPQATAYLVKVGLATIERLYASPLTWHFDAYVAGTVFEPPNQALRGRSFSISRTYFFLHDGTGNAADQQYIATHELTHVISWNLFGYPGSAMLAEGVAVYMGMESIAGSDHLPLQTFCAAYLQAGQLPRVTALLSFEGHIYDLQNYYTAGCFVEFLIETYGSQKFGQNYSMVNYEENYGQTLWTLEDAWRSGLLSVVLPETLDPARFVQGVKDVEAAYQSLLPVFRARPEQLEAYRELDKVRLALLEGRLDEMDQHLAVFQKLLNP